MYIMYFSICIFNTSWEAYFSGRNLPSILIVMPRTEAGAEVYICNVYTADNPTVNSTGLSVTLSVSSFLIAGFQTPISSLID